MTLGYNGSEKAYSLFDQSILLLGEVFNATSYFRKNILDALINAKPKMKKILREQLDCLNPVDNQYLFDKKTKK